MAEINHEIKIQASAESVYRAISTVQGLRGWYSAQAFGSAEPNGLITFEWEDKPTFQWKVLRSNPGEIVWECTQGPGDSVGTKVSFTIRAADDDRTLVEFSHTEWPGHHGNYRKCNTLWGILLHHLKNYVEAGNQAAAFK